MRFLQRLLYLGYPLVIAIGSIFQFNAISMCVGKIFSFEKYLERNNIDVAHIRNAVRRLRLQATAVSFSGVGLSMYLCWQYATLFNGADAAFFYLTVFYNLNFTVVSVIMCTRLYGLLTLQNQFIGILEKFATVIATKKWTDLK